MSRVSGPFGLDTKRKTDIYVIRNRVFQALHMTEVKSVNIPMFTSFNVCYVPSHLPMAYSIIYMLDFSVCVCVCVCVCVWGEGSFLCGADLWPHGYGMTPVIKYVKFKNTMETSSISFKIYLSVRKWQSSLSQRPLVQALTGPLWLLPNVSMLYAQHHWGCLYDSTNDTKLRNPIINRFRVDEI